MANLLKRRRAEHDLTYLMVSHNLSLVGFMFERMAVMYQKPGWEEVRG